MVRLIVAIVVTATAVVFVMANTHEVKLSFIFGPPVEVRMIFLLMSTFVLGAVSSGFLGLVSNLRLKRRLTRQRRAAKKAASPPAGDMVTE